MKIHYRPQRAHIKGYLFGVVFLALLSTLAIHPSFKQVSASTPSDTSSAIPTASQSPNVATSTSSPNTPLGQNEADNKALAAKYAAEAQQDVTSAQNSQLALNNETPPSTPTTSTTPGYTAPDQSLCPGIKAQEQTALAPYTTQAQQLNNALYGFTPSQLENPQTAASLQIISNKLNTVEAQISSIEQQYNPQLAANECL